MHRRTFLQSLCLAGLGLAARPALGHALNQMAQLQFKTAVRTPLGPLPPVVRVEGPLELRAAIVPGTRSQMAFECREEGQVVRNPVLRVRKGQRLQVKLINGLAEPTTIHWHGLDADWTQAGHPSYFLAAPGQSFQTDFEVTNRAGTYWYHAHPDMLTARQVHQGLAGMIVVDDEEDDALARAMDFQLGESDLPLFIQDRRLDAEGQPVYAPGPGDLEAGLFGEKVFVNGEENPSFSLPSRGYRLRLLNASNARSYLLSLLVAGQAGDMPFQLLGVDGGLLSKPLTVTRLFLSPGERADIYLDLSGDALVGRLLTLASQPFDPMHLEMPMPGRDGGQGQDMGHGTGGAGMDTPPGMSMSAPGGNGHGNTGPGQSAPGHGGSGSQAHGSQAPGGLAGHGGGHPRRKPHPTGPHRGHSGKGRQKDAAQAAVAPRPAAHGQARGHAHGAPGLFAHLAEMEHRRADLQAGRDSHRGAQARAGGLGDRQRAPEHAASDASARLFLPRALAPGQPRPGGEHGGRAGGASADGPGAQGHRSRLAAGAGARGHRLLQARLPGRAEVRAPLPQPGARGPWHDAELQGGRVGRAKSASPLTPLRRLGF